MPALLLLSLMGCWKTYDALPPLDFSAVPYQVGDLVATDAVITGFESDISCPDGENARFFAVYREGLTEEAPIALVFHSGAFDYVLDPDAEAPLTGEHYYLDSRLDRSWSVSKVWETLGMLYPTTVDASEVNMGALPAALTDAGFVQIYPANCWGDLWHNWPGNVSNDATDGFDRAGLALAAEMVDIVIDADRASSVDFSLPVQTDPNEIYLIGLGEGGRAVSELLALNDTPPIRGALLDSAPDDLSAYTANAETYAEEIEGLSRIFLPDTLASIETFSLSTVSENDLPERLLYLWSSVDPRLPAGAGESGAAFVEGLGSPHVSINTGRNAHVVSNGDAETAAAVVDFLLNGTSPDLGQ